MGKIQGVWCFLGKTGEEWCDNAMVDTGATEPVLPYADARRLGTPVTSKLVAPRLADKRKARGRWFWIDAVKSSTHGCTISPVLVFGQYGRKSTIIGARPLQKSGADITLDEKTGDKMRCRRPYILASRLGADVNKKYVQKEVLKDFRRWVKKYGPPTI